MTSSKGFQLSCLTMLFEATLHNRGKRSYRYSILQGAIGAADGAGFVFATAIKRTNIQRMRTIFLNRHGYICVRDLGSISKIKSGLPPLSIHSVLTLTIDLDADAAHFAMQSADGKHGSVVIHELSLQFNEPADVPRSGFFCAILTEGTTVSLH